MRTIYLLGLYCVFIATTAIGLRNSARFSRRSVSRHERDASGQDIKITEIVTSERSGDDGAPPTVKEEEVETSVSDNGKRFLHKRRKREVPENTECQSVKPPESGQLECRQVGFPFVKNVMSCKAVCIDNYKFPDGSVSKPYTCIRGGNGWKKVDVFNCQPAKEGIGCKTMEIGKNQTYGCITNSETKRCKSQCYAGYRFPNGDREILITCTKSTGVYDPFDRFPDCLLTDIKDDDSGISVIFLDTN